MQKLKDEVKDAAGDISEAFASAAAEQERGSRIQKEFSASEFGIWERLKKLFSVIDQGSEQMNAPGCGGHV